MRQEVLDRDLALCRDRIKLDRRGLRAAAPSAHASAGFLCHRHFHLFELGDELRHRIVEPHLSLFHEHEDGRAADDLRHRPDAEDRIPLHRLLRFQIHQTIGFHVRDTAFARHHRDSSREFVRFHVTLDGLVDP